MSNMIKLVVSLICIYLVVLVSETTASAGVHVDNALFVDSNGRNRIYHGANFVQKGYPWYPEILLDEQYVSLLAQTGVNFVRLGMMWAGTEPQPQQYNATYLSIMQNIIDLLGSHGIYVLLDMHQDVLSTRTGSYDGIPSWLYDRFPAPKHAYPWPLKQAPESWFNGYLSEACSHGFQCLYDNIAGARDSMANFWKHVALTFKNSSNVIGYELINEPWAGNYLVNPTLVLPGVAGALNLEPFYEIIAKAIRSVDNDTLIFYEPVTWGVRLNGKYAGTGFSEVPGGSAYQDRSVLSYHYYCIILSLIPVPGNETLPIYDRVLCDDVEGPALFRSVQVDLKQLGGSAFLTEFGGCDGSPTCDDQLEWGLDAADQFLQSWAYWGDLSPQTTALQTISRIYARAIAGRLLAMQYISKQRSFHVSYYIDTTIKQPTEIYVPITKFPVGSYNVTVSSGLQWRMDSTNPNLVLVEPSSFLLQSHLRDPVIGTVEIRPKS